MHECMSTVGDTIGHGMGFAVQLNGVVNGCDIETGHGEGTSKGLYT